MTPGHPKNNTVKYWAIAGLIISWATFWMFLFSPFGLIVWLGILIYLVIKRAHLKWYLIFSAWLFVPGWNFLAGTVQYLSGTATLKSVGGPQTFHGIDLETRVPSTSSGCIFLGYEPFAFPANNAAVRLWTNIFGYQRNSYAGVYPTKEEAQEILQTADTINVTQLKGQYEFDVKGISISLNKMDFEKFHYGEPVHQVVGQTIADECFIFRQVAVNNDNENPIYVVDIKNSRMLAQYFQY